MNNRGIIIIGKRDSGKSTFLFNKFVDEYAKGKRILVIDSAAEHIDKSLIYKIRSHFENEFLWISSCSKHEITFHFCSENDYPVTLVKGNDGKCRIFLADTAKYLENGYNYPAGEERQKERVFYQKLSVQIIQQLSSMVDVILMDEIELFPEAKPIIRKALSEGVLIYDALHEEKSLSGLRDMFDVVFREQFYGK